MSVAQVKKQFEDFATYLGRDTVGLEKLKKLKDAVNVLRTNMASAQEQSTASQAARQSAVARTLVTQRELANSNIELHSLRQQVANLTRDLKAATKLKQDEDTAAPNTKLGSVDQTMMTEVIKKVRTKMKFCPPAICVNHVKRGTSRDKQNRWAAFTRDSLSEGWSHDALWLLGASVALLSSLFGEVRVETDKHIDQFIKDDGTHEGFGRHLVQWMNKHNRKEMGYENLDTTDKKYYQVELEQDKQNAMRSQAGYSGPLVASE